MSVPSASVWPLSGPVGGATTTNLPLTAVASIEENAYGPVKYMPVTPVWKALLVSVVVSLSELGWTTLGVPQYRFSKYCTDLSDSGLSRVAVNLPLLPLK